MNRRLEAPALVRVGENDQGEIRPGICLFLSDEQTGRFLFNAKALQALGINLVDAQQCGYRMNEQSALAEAAEDPSTGWLPPLLTRKMR